MKIKTLKEFQDKFNSIKDTVSDKQLFVETELKEIDNYLSYNGSSSGIFQKRIPTSLRPKEDHIFEMEIPRSFRNKFAKEVKEFLIYDKVFELDSIEEEYNNEISELAKEISEQAYEFSKYIKWLRELYNPQTSNPQPKKSTLTHKQKMLALHYLGLNLSKFENTNSAKVLSQILDLDYDNTRKYLSYLAVGKNEVRTKKNLEALFKIFDIQGFENIINTIKKDTEKL